MNEFDFAWTWTCHSVFKPKSSVAIFNFCLQESMVTITNRIIDVNGTLTCYLWLVVLCSGIAALDATQERSSGCTSIRSEGCTASAIDRSSSLEVLRWLHENQTEGCIARVMDNPAGMGFFEVLFLLLVVMDNNILEVLQRL